MRLSQVARVRWVLSLVMAGLFISGVTAFPLESELRFLGAQLREHLPTAAISVWVNTVAAAYVKTNAQFPFLAYGTDWLAFAHVGIALAFIGPWKDPIRNVWVVEWGMILCILVVPLALVAGAARGIPMFHRVIDCCFGALAYPLLRFARTEIRRFERAVSS